MGGAYEDWGEPGFDVIESLRLQRFGPRDPTVALGPGRFCQAAHTPLGPVALDVVQRPEAGGFGRLLARLVGPGAEWVRPRLPEVLGLADEGAPSALAVHPGLRPLLAHLRRARLTRALALPSAQVLFILQQRVTAGEAMRSWQALAARGGPAPGAPELPPLLLPPAAVAIERLSQPAAFALGIDAQRWRTLRFAAQIVSKIERLDRLPRAEAIAALEVMGPHLRGHGPWTLGFMRGLGLADPDAVPLGDVHLPHDVAALFTGAPTGDDARMLELLAPFRGHRFRVLRALLAVGRRGP